MGFDNECIPNIQSLAGEYFCPVCRLLVYPNEALQSQCTHLYCKPCLTYIVGTTRACPYDGYLVTEADSKPLVESNKALAETIGKTTVNCLFHRSGCTWQGPLSESTSHCSGCAFGNSPVVCNRCAVQIVHRQVQEHAQSCSGVQPQAQNSEGAQPVTTMNVAVTGDQAQAAAQVAAPIQYAQTSTTSTTPGQDSNQQAVTTTQPQPAVLTAVPTAEQWYQHQQYYQQYPGYDPYQQQYQQHYPYQQPAVAQYQQPQLQPQPQMQSLQNQSQPHPQLPVIAPPQNQVQINPQLQTPTAVQPQTQYQTQPQPQPQAQPQAPPQPHAPLHAQAQPPSQTNLLQPHANLQMPQYQHPYAHMQHQQPQVQAHTPSQTQYQNHPLPQPRPSSLAQQQPIPQTFTSQPGQPVNSNLQPQAQQQSANAVTGYQSFPQPQTHQQMPLGAPQHTLQMHPQGGPQPQAQHTIHMQSQFPQQPTPLRPPQSKTTMQNPQQPVVLPSQGQVPSVPPVPQQPVHSHSHQPVLPVHQRPVMQPVQQQMHQPHVQNQYPFAGQPWGPVQNQVHQHDPHVQQHPHVQSYMRPQGAPQLSQLPPNPYSQQTVASPHSLQAHQAQNLAGRPIAPLHATPAQSVTPSTVGMHVRPTMPAGAPQQSGNLIWTANQTQSSSEQQSVAIPRQMPERQIDNSLVKGAESKSLGTSKKELENTTLVNTIKSENDMTRMDDVGKVEAQDVPESLAAETGKPLLKPVKEEPEKSDNPDNVTAIDDKKQEHPDPEYKDIEDGPKPKTNRLQFEHLEQGTMKSEKDKVLHSQSSGAFPPQAQVQDGGTVQQSHSAAAGDISIHHGSSALQQKPSGPPFLQAPHSGAPHHTQLPVHPPTEFRPIGSGNTPHPGQPLYPPSEQFQLSIYKQPHGAEVSNSGSLGPGPSFGRGPSQYGPLHGSYSHPPFQGEQMPSHVHELDISANQRPSNKDGGGSDSFVQHSGMHSNLMKMNGTSGIDSSLTSEDRLRPFRDENSNLFPQYPAQHNRVEFEGDLKHFPRPPHLGPEPVPRFGSHFNSSRPLERGHHGFGMDLGPQPLDKGSRGLNYESGLNMEPLGGSAPSRRFFPPFHHDDMVHPGDLVERPMGFHENAVGRLDSSRTRPDFLGSFRGYGRHHMDDFTSRSPGSEYRGMMPHGFVPHPGADDVGGRESRRFGDPISSSFGDGRFPALPSHLRRGDIETPGNLQMEEHLRSSDFFAQDGRSNHLRRGEHLGPRNPPGHVRLGEPVGFGAFPGRAGMGESPGPGNFYHQRFGEPGFRSNLPLKGFPSDGGSYPGDFESFDGLRKRKPSKMGWCRICKVDCVTVEGLDMHSQTSEHQKMAMDIVATIKRNAKKQKLPSSDKASIEDADKSKNSSSEGRGNKL